MKIKNKIIIILLILFVVFLCTSCKKKEEKYELYQVKSLVTNEESPLFNEYEYYYLTLDYKDNTIFIEYKFKNESENKIKNGTFVIENNEMTITLENDTIQAKINEQENTIIVNLVVLEFYYKKIN